MQTLILQEDEATNGLKLCDISPRILSESEIIARLSRMTDGEYLVIKGRISVGVKVRETRDKVTFSDKPPTLTRQKS